MTQPRIVTIGVYGYSEQEFFAALQAAQVDLFCDIRRRRGVRGSQYAFANSRRLQAKLADLGIAYRHVAALAPSTNVRHMQYAVDKALHTAKRRRAALDPAFIAAYAQECLAGFSPQAFLDELPADVKVAAFFCVERAPEACHRSLAAAQFAAIGLEVEHIR
ncbi:MAG: DUF488 domain-containing protein [Caldilineaceae bacterium]|nr:DUF488 domain-containing protein [Caldilineaceae bacterium]